MARRDSRVRVVGLTFRPGYPDNCHRLSEILGEYQLKAIQEASAWADLDADEVVGPPVLLVHATDNEHDANAVEVHVPALGRRQWVGFIPKDLAARWAPRLDSGQFAEAIVSAVPITPDHIDRPGVEIRVRFHLPECAKADHPELNYCSCDDFTPDWSTS